jgi:tRNA(fMet)-specific endonuclease VapC
MWVLDTDTLTLWLRGYVLVVRRVEERDPDELAITIITVEEILSGWYRLIRLARTDDKLALAYKSLQQSIEFFRQLQILPFDNAAIRRFHDLRRQHRTAGTNDLRIAAMTLASVGSLVSRNLRDFRPIAGLHVGDWSIG